MIEVLINESALYIGMTNVIYPLRNGIHKYFSLGNTLQ